jgi:hypothetical protein
MSVRLIAGATVALVDHARGRTMIAMKFTMELDIGLSSAVLCHSC